jgi:hypothetical protein
MEIRSTYLNHDSQSPRGQPQSPVSSKNNTSALEARQFDAVRSDATDFSPDLKFTVYRNKSGAN